MILKYTRRKTAYRRNVIIAPTRDRQRANHRIRQQQGDLGTILVVEMTAATIAVRSTVDQLPDHEMQIDLGHVIALLDHQGSVLEVLVKRIGGMFKRTSIIKLG